MESHGSDVSLKTNGRKLFIWNKSKKWCWCFKDTSLPWMRRFTLAILQTVCLFVGSCHCFCSLSWKTVLETRSALKPSLVQYIPCHQMCGQSAEYATALKNYCVALVQYLRLSESCSPISKSPWARRPQNDRPGEWRMAGRAQIADSFFLACHFHLIKVVTSHHNYYVTDRKAPPLI